MKYTCRNLENVRSEFLSKKQIRCVETSTQKRHPKAEFSWKTTSHKRPRFTVKSPETRVMSPEIHPACFVSPWHHCLRNESYLQNYPACFVSLSLKERDILHTLFIKISGDLSKNFGRHDSGFERYNFGRDDFRATWLVTATTTWSHFRWSIKEVCQYCFTVQWSTVHIRLRVVSTLHDTNLPNTQAKSASAIYERAAHFLLRSDTSSEKRLLAFCGFKCTFSRREISCKGKLAQVNGA